MLRKLLAFCMWCGLFNLLVSLFISFLSFCFLNVSCFVELANWVDMAIYIRWVTVYGVYFFLLL